MLTVNDLLSRKGNRIVSIEPDVSVYEALRSMSENDIGALLVMEDNKLRGVFSERDYARKVILSGKSSQNTLVKDVMVTRLFSVHPEDDVEDCMRLMTEQHIRHLPVFQGEHLIGIITIGDVVKGVIEDQKTMINDLENYISGGYFPKSFSGKVLT